MPVSQRIQGSSSLRRFANERDYSNLHAFKKWPGTSQEFYEFYQNRICGWSGKALGVARRVTKLIVEGAEPKRLKEFQKPDAFKKAFAAQNAVRRIISNDLSLSDYDFLFPSEYHPIRVKREGWDLIRFYLAQAQIQNLPLPESSAMPTTHKKIELIAGEYFRSRGLSKVKGLLDRLSRGKVGTPWLREIFCRMAELHPEFELGDWDEFVCDENGKAMPVSGAFPNPVAAGQPLPPVDREQGASSMSIPTHVAGTFVIHADASFLNGAGLGDRRRP